MLFATLEFGSAAGSRYRSMWSANTEAIQGPFLPTAHLNAWKTVLCLVSLMKCSIPRVAWGLSSSGDSCGFVPVSQCPSWQVRLTDPRLSKSGPARRVLGCLVAKPSPSPCRCRAHIPLECSWGRDPLSRGSASPAAPCVHRRPLLPVKRLLSYAPWATFTPGGQYTQTN